MKRLLAAAGASLLLISSAAFAVPSAQQVERAMGQGNWQQADAELSEVLRAHPNNAHAHYLYGQVLAREGRYAEGLTQIEQAKALDPTIRFTDPTRFAQVEASVRSAAKRAGVSTMQAPAEQATPNAFQAQSVAPTNAHRGPSMAAWIGMAIVIIAIALVLRWTLRRSRSNEDSRADEERREQLKRATELLNETRSIKLDARLSTAPGHEAVAAELEGVEAQLRDLVETLSGAKNPVPAYRLEEIDRQLVSLKARAEGRPDPNAAAATAAAPGYGASSYAQEAERFQQQGPQPPYQQPYQQPPVVVQQGGGFGSGVGGLLTGVLLGEALSQGRDRVVERDVYIDDDARRRGGNGGDGGNGGGLDFGQGSNDWSDNSGGVDYGGDDSGGWTDT